jgi:SSS family solute:Na+ symporter
MNVTFLDMAAIAIYFLCVWWFGYMTRRTKTFTEYSIAKHSIPTSMIFASLCAGYVGPGFAVGFTSKGFSSGFTFYLLAMTFVVQTLLVGLFVAPRLSSRFRDCHTLGDVMERMYGKFAHVLAGIISIGLCIGFSAIMAKVGGGILQAITGWNLMLCIALVTSITCTYTTFGGIRASIAEDALHFGLFSIVVPIMLLVAFMKSPAPVSEVTAKAMELTSTGFAGMNGIQIFAIMLSFLLGETLVPPYANRALASKSSGDSRKGFVMAGLYGVIWLAIVVSLGIYGHQFVPQGTEPDNVFVAMGAALLPHGAFGMLLAALVAIVMSSQDSVMNAGSASIVRDLFCGWTQGDEKKSLRAGRMGTVFIAVVATITARYSPGIIDGLLICYSIWAPAMLLPLLIGLFSKRTMHAAGWLSMIAGGGGSIIWQSVLKEPSGIPAILAGLVVGLVFYIIGSLVGRTESYQKGVAR